MDYNDLMMDEEEQTALNAIKRDLKKRNNTSGDESMMQETSYESILGTSKSFKEIRQGYISNETKNLWFEFAFDFTLLTIITIIILVQIFNHSGCGIPIREWILGFFTIWLLKSSFNLFKICVLNKCF